MGDYIPPQGIDNRHGHLFSSTFPVQTASGAPKDRRVTSLLVLLFSAFCWSQQVRADGEGGADPDSDGDGLMDVWELTYAPDLTVFNSSNDPDGDQVSNLDEEAGTNPQVADTDSAGRR